MNKNDLRWRKTEKVIRQTYYKLCMENFSLIKISDLCNEALINKTTFYAHYENIAQLSDCVCKEKISDMLKNCPNIDKAFIDTESFVYSMVSVLKENQKDTMALFKNDIGRLLNVIEECLLKIYLCGNEPSDKEALIRFAIGGASRLLIQSQSKKQIQETIKLIHKLI